MEMNQALCHLGNHGKWQSFYFILLSTMSMSLASFHMLSIVFIGFKPPHKCKLPSIEHTDMQQMPCEIYFNSSNHSLPCQQGWLFPNFTGSTIVTEWDLVCTREHLPSASQTWLTVGTMLGGLIFGYLADKFGRKKLSFTCILLLSILSVTTCFSVNIKMFMFLRFLVGFIFPGFMYAPFVLLCETFPVHQRENVGIMSQIFWSFASCLSPVLAYYVENWRYYQMCLSLFSVFLLPFFYFLRESVLWDISKGRIEHAEETLRIAAKMNGVTFKEPILLQTELNINGDEKFENENTLMKQETKFDKSSQDVKTISFLKIFSNRIMLFYLSSMTFLTVVNTLVYYGLSLSTGVVQGNRLWNAFYGAFAEIPGVVVSMIATKNFGRKRCMLCCYMLTGVFSLLAAIVDHQQDVFKNAAPILFGALNTLNKFFISVSYVTCFLYAPELFPTSLRNSAIGIYSFFGRVGLFFGVLGAYFSEKNVRMVMLLYGIFSILASVLIIFLPETQNKPLPNTIQEAEDLRKK